MLSPRAHNQKSGLELFCPVTSARKGYPYEVVLPEGLPVAGAVLCDQIKSLDWRARKAEVICRLPEEAVADMLARMRTLTE